MCISKKALGSSVRLKACQLCNLKQYCQLKCTFKFTPCVSCIQQHNKFAVPELRFRFSSSCSYVTRPCGTLFLQAFSLFLSFYILHISSLLSFPECVILHVLSEFFLFRMLSLVCVWCVFVVYSPSLSAFNINAVSTVCLGITIYTLTF